MTLEELLRIELPVIQAPMAGVQGGALAAAVSGAGGLGSVPCAMLGPDGIRKEVATVRAATSQPFNVNFFCHAEAPPDEAADAAWCDLLAPYCRELGIPAPQPPTGAARVPFNAAAAEVMEELRPPVLSFHFGLPAPELLARVRGWGARILASATTVAEALWLQERGVDAIIAQGWEAGGHRGHFLSADLTEQPGTFALVPQVVRAVRVPVIAAGGIADANAVAAARALGAAGVQVGTAYLLCPEATTSNVHRAALKDAGRAHTAVTNVFTGRPARSIVNRIVRELGPLNPRAPAFPRAAGPLAPLRAAAEKQGSGEFSPLWSGQNASGCKEIPAAQLTRELAGAPAR
jgi:nitronate monooxygenase